MDKEALIILSEMLDKARIQANAIEVTAPQTGIYGQIRDAEIATLALVTDAYTAQRIYGDIIQSGNTVREALAVVEAGR